MFAVYTGEDIYSYIVAVIDTKLCKCDLFCQVPYIHAISLIFSVIHTQMYHTFICISKFHLHVMMLSIIKIVCN